MRKEGKVLIVVVAVVLLAVIGGVFALHYMVDNVGTVKIEVEDLPCGLEWGMTKEEVRTALEGAGYLEQETTTSLNLFLYRVPVYQGQPDARAIVMCVFDEQDVLDWARCEFRETSAGGLMESSEKIDEVQAAFEKAYEKECEEVFIDPDPIASYEYCLMEKSLVSFNRYGKGLSVIFENREDETIQELIEELRVLY